MRLSLSVGIFTAIAAVGRDDYLTMQGFGYGLAVWARLLGERAPNWAKYLDPGPRMYLRQGLRYLRKTAKAPA